MDAGASENKPLISTWKIFLAIAIGIGVSLYLIVTTFDPAPLKKITFSYHLLGGFLLAALSVVIRDAAFMYKVRLSTGVNMKWGTALRAILMWEFGACVTPKLGEVPFTLYVLKKSGVGYGRSMATLMLNAFLDNFVFVILFSLMFVVVGPGMLQITGTCADLKGHGVLEKIRVLANHAWVGYFILLSFSLFLFVAIFRLPHTTRRFFHGLATWKIFKPIRSTLTGLGDEIEITADEFKKKRIGFWAGMTTATVINWMARYALANALLYAFSDQPLDMLQVYSRQFVIWVFIVIPSTPGSSGIAEGAFMALNCEFMPAGLAATITVVWRIYSYYLYLLIGTVLWPRWIRRNHS